MVLLIILQRVPYIGKGKISRYSEHGKMTGINKIANILWIIEKAREF